MKNKFPPFSLLWTSYPKDSEAPPGRSHAMPCNEKNRAGEFIYDNQCAIRLSYCLIKAGISLGNYTDPKCRDGYARGAESLANWIWRNYSRPHIVDCKKPGEKDTFRNGKYATDNGIIFFKDFYDITGDHIDLLYHDNSSLLTGSGNYFERPEVKQIWFWSIK